MPIATFTPGIRTAAEASVAAQQLLQLTEAAARAAAPMIGQGDKLGADEAAVGAMEDALYENRLSCQSVICEGEKDGSFELSKLVFGDEYPPRYDLAADPVECTTAVAAGRPGGMSIAALGERGQLMPWIGVPYMQKLVVGPRAAELLDNGEVNIKADPGINMIKIAKALGKPVTELTVAMLDRPRNERIKFAAKQLGAQLLLLEGGDVTPALQTCIGREVDMLYSSGGAPEGVITAAAIAALNGNMQAMIDPQNRKEAALALKAGLLGRVLNLQSLVGDGEVHFAATGITETPLLTGAHFRGGEWYQGNSILLSRVPQADIRHL